MSKTKKFPNRQAALASIKAACPNDFELFKIIELCQLYPKPDWRHWTDYQGNFLTLTQDQKVLINKTESEDNFIITDIYHKVSISKLSQISIWAFIIFGQNDNQEPIMFIWFLGYDQRLRLISFVKDTWLTPESPLSCGLPTLRVLMKNLEVMNYREIWNQHLQGPIEAKVIKSWTTIWPPSQEFINEMMSPNDLLTKQLLTDCHI